MNDTIFEPLKHYETYAKAAHKENVTAFFDGLVKTSGVNEEENRSTVKQYKNELAIMEKLGKQMAKYRLLKALFIVLAVGLGIALAVWLCAISPWFLLLILPLCGFIAIFPIVKWLNPKLKKLKEEHDAHAQKAKELLELAWQQMEPLNRSFRDSDTFRLMEKTVPIWKFQDNFSASHLKNLVENYDYTSLGDENASVVEVISGEMCENPFVFERLYKMNMGTQTYTGTLTIVWTETYYSQGKRHTRRRSQVLRASVVKPKPFYHYDTHLGYGSQAAPDLHFSRQATHAEDLSENQLERKIKRGSRKIKKKAEAALDAGRSFQDMANEEFDVLFGALDRDHEVQFRLLFTPLAQQNTVDLITSETGYGDDFAFYKRNKYNIIRTEHAQHWPMTTSASRYRSYDIDVIRETFISFNENYFKSVYFDMAPLMAIPAYQEKPANAFMTPLGVKSLYAVDEHEAMANAIGSKVFMHPNTTTDVILKTQTVASDKTKDTVCVSAYSFEGVGRVDYVPVLGGDGHMHAVPVHWVEYLPLEKVTHMLVQTGEAAQGDESNLTYYHGLSAYTL